MTTKRRIFYSFHYQPDNWRASQVRNIGVVEGNEPTSDNDWEQITRAGDSAIRKWIHDQMKYRSCTIVLVGSGTADRKWINYEIEKSWDERMGVVGIYIHGLKNSGGYVSKKGNNPFNCVNHRDSGKAFSSIVKCYNPQGRDSKEKYDWIKRYIAAAAAEAVEIRANYN